MIDTAYRGTDLAVMAGCSYQWLFTQIKRGYIRQTKKGEFGKTPKIVAKEAAVVCLAWLIVELGVSVKKAFRVSRSVYEEFDVQSGCKLLIGADLGFVVYDGTKPMDAPSIFVDLSEVAKILANAGA